MSWCGFFVVNFLAQVNNPVRRNSVYGVGLFWRHLTGVQKLVEKSTSPFLNNRVVSWV